MNGYTMAPVVRGPLLPVADVLYCSSARPSLLRPSAAG